MCRVAKEEYYNTKCRELQELDRVHSNLLYDKVNECQLKAHKVMQQIKSCSESKNNTGGGKALE